jgi:hypothetical protein
MPQPHTLDWATPTDYDALADIVFDAVRNGPSKYTQSQRAAWVPVRRGGEEWAARLKGQVIAIARDGNPPSAIPVQPATMIIIKRSVKSGRPRWSTMCSSSVGGKPFECLPQLAWPRLIR